MMPRSATPPRRGWRPSVPTGTARSSSARRAPRAPAGRSPTCGRAVRQAAAAGPSSCLASRVRSACRACPLGCALRSAAGPFRIAQIREISLINDCLRPLLPTYLLTYLLTYTSPNTVLFHPLNENLKHANFSCQQRALALTCACRRHGHLSEDGCDEHLPHPVSKVGLLAPAP